MSDSLPEVWLSALKNGRTDQSDLSVDAIVSAASDDRGGSVPFQVQATDGERYWVKQIANPQSARTPVTEQIIAGCGRLIGAPVRDVRLISIPKDFHGEKLASGITLTAGIAHASLNLEYAMFDKTWEPQNRHRDDNRRRHAAYFAFFDWCWGYDRQWLYDVMDDLKLYSHDHGHFLPGSPDWTTESLLASREVANPLGTSPEGLDYNELARVADVLENLTTSDLRSVLCGIPSSWPVSDFELETVGFFLDSRRLPVARRIRQLAATLAG